MQLSKRVMSVSPSPTLAMNARANQLRAEGVDIINFGVGQPDFDTPAHVCEAAKAAIDSGQTRYTPVDGTLELKQAVIDKFKRDNALDYTMDQVMVNVGGKHSSYLLMQALLNDGDEVIIPAPYWVSYPPMVVLAGGVPVIIPTRQEDGFKLTADALARAITPKTRALFINSPSNPTGMVYTARELKPLVDLCVEKGVLIISDEMYEAITFTEGAFVAIASLGDGAYEHTVTLNGVSKAYAMTGWRIGYMGGPKDLVRACAKIQSQSTSNPSSVAQAAAVAALSGPQDQVLTMKAAFHERRDYMLSRLLSIPGVTCPKAQGAFYLFPDVSAYFGKSAEGNKIEGSLDMGDYLLTTAHVALVPGAAFGEDACIRLSYAASKEVIGKGMDRLAKALGKLK